MFMGVLVKESPLPQVIVQLNYNKAISSADCIGVC